MRVLPFLLFYLFVLSCQKEGVTVKNNAQSSPSCHINQDELRRSVPNSSNARPERDPYPQPKGNYSCIYIDFDGETVVSPYWNNGATIHCESSGLSLAQQKAVLSKVRGYFYPFRVYVTDTLDYFVEANRNKRMQVIVTPTSYWKPIVGGVAMYNSFVWGNETPAFVFSDRLLFSEHYVAELVAHETGHTLNLSHQSLWTDSCQMAEPLTPGVIMGNSLSVSTGVWTYGPTSMGCAVFQDDSTMIKTKLGLRL